MSSALFDLTGKTALITGASRGIGAACAVLLAEHGAHVVITSRKQENLQQTTDRILAAGGQVTPIESHAGDTDATDRLLAAMEEGPGAADILLSNAAANPYFGPMLDVEMSAVDKVIEVNLRGSFYLAREVARKMQRKGGGNIVLVSSVNGVRAGHWQGIYSISKAALISMAKAMAREYAVDGIRVNAVLPGLTDTRFASALTQDEKILQSFLRQVPMNRIAQPEEIASAVLYLVSPASSYVTGVCLPVDGGFLA
ncbi:MAG: glucose 1-dehydrogenase [Proteobacteria bacterium]|nr:glucose 1-dehydrogenase [Pseudomonadota bacterium]